MIFLSGFSRSFTYCSHSLGWENNDRTRQLKQLSPERLIEALHEPGCRAEILAGNYGLEASKIMVTRGLQYQHLTTHPCLVYFNLSDEQAGLVSLSFSFFG